MIYCLVSGHCVTAICLCYCLSVDADVWNWCAGRHRCTQCDYTVDRQHILDYHMKNVHAPSILAPLSVTHPDNTDDQMTATDHSDEETTVADAGQFQQDATNPAPPAKRGRTQGGDMDQVMAAYQCINCGYSGHSVGAMARHHLSHSTWSLPYPCQQCSYRATTRRLLTRHIKTHDGDYVQSLTDHACRHCPYKSSSALQVAAHERFHGARRRYRCPYCSYGLDRRRLLIQHRRLHAADCGSPLRCPHVPCPFTCRDRQQLTAHRRQHAASRRRRHACDCCSFAVDSRNAMLHHQRLHDLRRQ